MNQATALIIDDEPDIRELLEITLSRMGINVRAAANITDGKSLLKNQHFDLCLTDMNLPDGDGIELVEYIQKNYPQTPVAMITAHGNMEAAISALKAGAYDFVSKPVDLNDLRSLVDTALRLSDAKPTANKSLTLLGNSAVMKTTRATIDKLARSQAPVYINGESGTGKELAARLIHDNGARSEAPFIAVNCGAIPSELMESEFFGHKKGSFTGAHNDNPGLFQSANGGTLFLDEVADLPLAMQVKLLRAIQEKAVRAVGASEEISINVRILSATHKNLARLVENGLFRQDLFYRINVIELAMPSLRDRQDDITELAAHLLSQLANAHQLETPEIQGDAIQALQRYSFPGNVRELENILERAMTLCENSEIHVHDLNLPQAIPEETHDDLDSKLDSTEKASILKALEQTGRNKTQAAKLLGISFNALRYRLRKLEIH
ncbi:MAG: sigma-54-dependent Fis family transcriptional regulator [Gammaproteobacteria bacterium]|nr:sigma-54-dependent Fis family transcriptional regulator [Gammaproteobacteria bacterium]